MKFGPSVKDHYTTVDVDRMRHDRAERLRSILRKHNVPAMLISGANNVRYATGFSSFEMQRQSTYALFVVEGDHVVFAPAGSYQQMPDLVPWVKEWRIARSWFGGIAGPTASVEEAGKFAAEVKQVLETRSLLSEQIALADFDQRAEAALRDAGINVVDGTMMLLESSAVKTPDEVLCLQMTAAISSAGFQAARENLKPGASQNEVNGFVLAALGKHGPEATRSKVLSGPIAFERAVTDMDRIIEYGDLAYVRTCATSYLGYTCCLYRTYKVGTPPTSEEADWYKQLKDRVDALIDTIRPGATTADAAIHFPPASKWGYADEAEVLTVEYGHGIGLVRLMGAAYINYNWPVINRQWSLDHPQVFEPGMVIAVESLEGAHRRGGVRVENMVVVTENGAERLDTYKDDEIVVTG